MSEAKVAWVTGGSAGIGLAIAEALAEDGYLTVISARNEAQLLEAAKQVGHGCEALPCDVADRAAVSAVCAEILRRHGRIDVLVNNAGGNSQKREWSDLVPEEFEAVIASNINGTFNTIHSVLPAMREQKNGLVINISSGAGKQVGVGAGVAYTVAKHGVHIMSKLLNQTELANGIRCCVITPAFVRTRAHDWRPEEVRNYMLNPEDVARAVRFAIESPPHTMIQEIEFGVVAGMNNGEALAAALKRHGIEVVFSQCFPVRMQHVAPKYGIRQIGFRTENAGGAMADGYARVAGRIAVFAGQSGPAATLMVPPLCEAMKASVPILALVDEYSSLEADKNAFQEFDHFALFSSCSKWIRRVSHSSRLDDYVDMAIVEATTGRPGPVILLLPGDFSGQDAVPAPQRTAKLGHFPLDRLAPTADRIAEAAAMLKSAKRPLIYAGGGVHLSGAADEVVRLAELGAIPVATGNMGKGAIAETHPLSLGVFGNCMGRGSKAMELRDYAARADCVLLVGTRTNANGTGSWTLFDKAAQFIHIDIDGLEVGRNYESYRLVGDAKATLAALNASLSASDFPDREASLSRIGADTAKAAATMQAYVEEVGGGRQGAVRPEHLMRVLDAAMKPEDVICVDASYSNNWVATFINLKAHGARFITPRGIAGLGWGMPMAMGAKLAKPEARVFALVGDGGFAHCWSELEAARRLDIPVVTIVLNNQILAYQRHGEEWFSYHHSDASDLGPVDHAAIARACGCFGERVDTPEQFAPALDRALASGLPAVLDVMTDPEAMPPLTHYLFRPPPPEGS